MEANRDRSKDGKDSKEREENRSERLSSLSLARLCLLSSCNESRCSPHRRKSMIEISHTSPKAKNGYWQIISIICPRAKWTVDFINSPSCRAGTYFRYAAKVSKDASKERRKPFGAVSLSPLKSPLLSTDRASPPHGKRAVSHVIDCVR